MSKKKILFVNNNMKIGGVQKALLEVLKQIHTQYEVTLLLFRKTGALLDQIPADVRVQETSSHFEYLGISQGECSTLKEKLTRGMYAVISKKLGIGMTTRVMGLTVPKKATEHYDAAISFLHCGAYKICYGGVAEYVLKHTNAEKKICYIHCDYANSGTASEYSKQLYPQFDTIACVSNSVRKQFLSILPNMKEKAVVVQNPVDTAEIKLLAQKDPFPYDPGYVNVLTVARLAEEKGVDRVIHAMEQMHTKQFRYYVVGDGILKGQLEKLINEKHLEDTVFLLGEDANPYRYMVGADLLMVPSYNEAAPVVFQEALVLGLPVFTTCTLSAKEMIPEKFGFVVNNTDDAILKMLLDVEKHPNWIEEKKSALENLDDGKNEFINQFQRIL